MKKQSNDTVDRPEREAVHLIKAKGDNRQKGSESIFQMK